MTTPQPPDTTTPAPDGAGARVLVVGHAPADRDALGGHVRAEGHIADMAADGDEAFTKLRAAAFDLVLLDAHMPGMDGPQFLRALRDEPDLTPIPVIVFSAADDLDVLTQCLEAGADDYLPREFRPAMLRARLRAARHHRRLRDAENLTREMDVARNIQRDFLPEILPVARGVQVEAVLHPALHVSGDFYDAFMLAPSGTIVLVVGDVCDKGVGAALFMALFRSLIRASADPVEGGAIQMIGGRRTLVRQSLEAATPADLLTRVAGFTNDYIARLHGRTGMFATAFLAALTPMTGEFDYVNAGHVPALVVAPDGTMEDLPPTGPVLGAVADQPFNAGGGVLERGHSIFAFTDGLVEARNPAGEEFGSGRLRDALAAHNTSASRLVHGVVDELAAFIGQAEPHDDVTLLAATRTIS